MSVQPATHETCSIAVQAPAGRPRVRIRRAIIHIMPGIILAVCLFGVVLRLTVQDRLWPQLSGWYYGLSPIVLSVLAIIAAGGWLWRRAWTMGCLASAVALVCGVWTSQTAWVTNIAPAVSSDGIRVMQWNAARGAMGWSHVAEVIRRESPDIVGLNEAGVEVDKMRALWQGQLPEYRGVITSHEITLLSKAPVRYVAGGFLPDAKYGRYEHVEVLLEDGPVHVVMIDIKSHPFRSRAIPMTAIRSVLLPLRDEPVLLMGDFNTPTDATVFDKLRRDYTHAFESVGNGYQATWPTPLPVLAIDHIWANRRVDIHTCQIRSTWTSDHRYVVAKFTTD